MRCFPAAASGLTDLVPWVTFTDPEVAHVGLTEEQARARFGESVQSLPLGHRAVPTAPSAKMTEMASRK